jgi:hypothetical protein
MKTKYTWIIIGTTAAVILCLSLYAGCQKYRADRLRSEALRQRADKNRMYLEEQIVGEILREKTTDELSLIGGVLWE